MIYNSRYSRKAKGNKRSNKTSHAVVGCTVHPAQPTLRAPGTREGIDHFLFDSLGTFDSAFPSLGDLGPRSTHHNYHHAIVLSSNVPSSGLEFTVSHLLP